MALIPLDMLQQLKKTNLPPLKNPNQNQLVKTMNQMEALLSDTSLPEDIKSNRVSETLKDFSIYADKMMPQHAENPPVAETVKRNDNHFLLELNRGMDTPPSPLRPLARLACPRPP